MGLIRNKVLNLIREDILSCDLQPGEELREAELAERYNVSKSPVRDALQQLQFEKLVVTVPRRGHQVTPISLSDAQDILEMRVTLETTAVRKIAKEATPQQLASLDAFREVDLTCMRTFARYNRKFHIELAKLCGNRRLAEEMRRLLDSYERICIASLERMKRDRGDMTKALADHCDLIDALQARDAARSARISQRHLKQSTDLVEKRLSNRPIVD